MKKLLFVLFSIHLIVIATLSAFGTTEIKECNKNIYGGISNTSGCVDADSNALKQVFNSSALVCVPSDWQKIRDTQKQVDLQIINPGSQCPKGYLGPNTLGKVVNKFLVSTKSTYEEFKESFDLLKYSRKITQLKNSMSPNDLQREIKTILATNNRVDQLNESQVNMLFDALLTKTITYKFNITDLNGKKAVRSVGPKGTNIKLID